MLTRKTKRVLWVVLVIALNVLGIFLFGFLEQLKLLLDSAFGSAVLLLLRKLYLIKYKEKPILKTWDKLGGIFAGIIFTIFIIIWNFPNRKQLGCLYCRKSQPFIASVLW